MQKTKFFFIFSILMILSIQGCIHRVDIIKIEGKFKGNPKSYIYINSFESDSLALLDSIKTSSSGKFSFEARTEEPTFIAIGLGSQQTQVILLVQPGDNVTITAGSPDLSDYKVSGSNGSALVREISQKLNDTKYELDSLKKYFERNIGNVKIDSIKRLVDSLYNIVLKRHKDFSKGFIKDNSFSPVSILALLQSYDPMHPVFDYYQDRKLFRLVDSTLMNVYSSSRIVNDYHSKILRLDSLFERRSNRNKMFKVGETLPNAPFPLVTGDYFFYSSTWYKYLLIDFNGEWCKFCEKSNMRLKPLFKEFSPKGLAILEVSLSVNVDSLKKQNARDSVIWYSVGIPDMYSSKLLDTLKISSLPSNYIIDRWGVIKAVNVNNSKLKEKLTELMPK